MAAESRDGVQIERVLTPDGSALFRVIERIDRAYVEYCSN